MLAQEILLEMDITIDKLIINAKEMNNASKLRVTKNEIDSFQNTQEKLIAHLIHIDNDYKTRCNEIKKPNLNSASNKIRKKLKQFESLNNEFIENTTSTLNVIHFNEKRNLRKPKIRKKRICSKAKINKN